MEPSLKSLDAEYVANTYKRFPVELVSGKGSLLFDADGKRYIDLTTGIAVNIFGVCDTEWQNAVISQILHLQHSSNLYYTEPCVKLAKLLCEKTGMKKVFFGNSGAEANECAIKVMRKYAAQKKGPEFSTIVTLENSFHGRTLTTLAATGQEHYHELFQPLTPGFVHTPANDLDAVKALFQREKVAGILMECVQGEGGVVPLEPDFVKGVAQLCAEMDVVLGFDEVQTGNGRSGKLYAYMNFGVTPDVVSTAKGIGGGLPLGACLMGEKVHGVLTFGDHGSTFGANPVACAGAVSIIGRIDDGLLQGVHAKSDYIRQRLEPLDGVEAVTGMGLMLGVKLKEKTAGDVVAECLKRGVLCLTAKDRVRLLPALNIPQDLLAEAIDILAAVIQE